MPEQPDFVALARKALQKMAVTGATAIEVTAAFQEQSKWKVNFSFSRPYSFIKNIGCLVYSDVTKEITGMWLNRSW